MRRDRAGPRAPSRRGAGTANASGVRLRAASAGDAESIAALSGELGYPAGPGTVRARLRRILAREDQLVIIAEHGRGRVCGWLQAHCNEALESGLRVEIVGLIVAKGMRRRGVGRCLVERAEAWAREVAAETVVVRSNARRLESHAFYPSLGYQATKTQVVYRKRAQT